MAINCFVYANPKYDLNLALMSENALIILDQMRLAEHVEYA
jgi:hypothetical protein